MATAPGLAPAPASPAPPVAAAALRAGRRMLVVAGGAVLLLAGVVMLALPGPGLLTIGLALRLLGREVSWAARLHDRARTRLVRAAARVARR